MTSAEIADRGTILRCVVGSTAHGLNVPGQDDRDEMGICVEPPSCVYGLAKFEQYISRSQPEGVRSQPGDLDLTIYGLRKWARLAAQGNPSVVILLYAEPLTCSYGGRVLRENAHLFASREGGKRFLGYMISQKQRLLGERGQMNVKRPDLISRHGYDTKYAMHMMRLGVQGVEYLTTGKLTLPLPQAQREAVRAVRRGEVGLNGLLADVADLEAQMEDLISDGPLPQRVDYDLINDRLMSIYLGEWEQRGMA